METGPSPEPRAASVMAGGRGGGGGGHVADSDGDIPGKFGRKLGGARGESRVF